MKGLKQGTALIHFFSMFMFVGGAIVTLILVAQAFQLKGTVLAGYFVFSCAAVLGGFGLVIARAMEENPWMGGALGGMLGAIVSVVIYFSTRHFGWWQ